MDAWGYLTQADKDEFERLDAAFARNEPLSGERGDAFGLWVHTRFCSNPDDPRRLALLQQVIDQRPSPRPSTGRSWPSYGPPRRS